MAQFVLKCTKREYILTALCLILLVLTVKHQEFFLCKEKPLSTFERFCVWLGVLEKPKPCPGVDDLYAMAMEMGLASVGVLASSLVLSALWGWTRSLPGSGIRAVHATVKCVKGIAPEVKLSVQNIGKGISKSVKGGLQFLSERVRFRKSAVEKKKTECKYFFFHNAHAQRGIIMILREYEEYNEISVQNPNTKKMECVLSYPKGH
ncbi:uncharacterized protein LOC111123020 [Crassostrea virginica]|uniref:Uncharacterized protein LOC111123020 n=1 Tax=Crassostrea virginica TaxID=6565 RepID=A0A8B8CYZ4_CRAVI|nr:uncharacterized protein LOC111123020 [Crassostrea virginica]